MPVNQLEIYMKEIMVPLFAGILALISTLLVQLYNRSQERKSLKRALLGEIKGILLLIQTRNYKNNLISWIHDLENKKELTRKSFLSNPKNNYFAIYEANAAKIGLLPSKSTTDIVEFYTLLKSLLEDSENEELFNRPTEKVISMLNENLNLLSKAIYIGEKAMQNLMS